MSHASLAERSVGLTAFDKTDNKLKELGVPTVARRLAGTVALVTAFAAPAFIRQFESHNQSADKLYRFPNPLLIDIVSFYGAMLVPKIVILGGAAAGLLPADNVSEIGGM